LRAFIRSFQEACTKAVHEHGGYVAKYLGDGLLAYFGYPRAQEDDAERAVRSSLVMVEEAGRLKAPESLQLRAGLETGLVVVGEMVGEGMAQQGEISGDTPNLAARLQALAEPGQVLIGPTIRRVLGSAFDCEDIGARTLKGIKAPIHAFCVLGERQTESRFDARQTEHLTDFAGRDAELDTLRRRWQDATEGDGHVVLISGEPGIGKSRLTHEFRESIVREPHDLPPLTGSIR
jgi:class 3 adenylate cyclase